MILRSSVIAFTSFISSLCAFQADDSLPPPTAEEAEKIVTEAYIWGYPVVVMYRTMKTMTHSRAPFNAFWRSDRLITADFKDVVSPNADTLYLSGWLDLCEQPVMLRTPDTHGRYFVIEFLDMYTNVFRNVGKRTTGTGAREFIITGPNWHGTLPEGLEQIKAPTNNVWLIGRVLVNGQEDLPAALDLSKKMTLSLVNRKFTEIYSKLPFGSPHTVTSAGVEFFDELGEALKGNPNRSIENEMMERFASVGIGEGKKPSRHLDDEMRVAFEKGIEEAIRQIDSQNEMTSTTNNGWSYSLKGGRYGTNYLLRAQVAKFYLGQNVPQESLYAVALVDSKGSTLSGSNRYVIHFNKDQIPSVDGFWSVTMYDYKTKLLVPNTTGQYVLGNRSKDMKYNPDGSLDMYIQNEPPEGKEGNWLPSPHDRFYLILRFYIPKKAILDGSYTYPTITEQS